MMKIGFFTDSHYSSQAVTCGNRYNSRSLEKIKDAYQFFQQKNCPSVKAVYQGHCHKGKSSLLGGIRYVTFPAMCEHEQAYFIEEI